MIPVKIECECGQRYAFDVEPVNGRMPSRVACPACGADGTVAANHFIAENTAAQPVTIPASTGGGLRVTTTPRTSNATAAEAQRIVKLGTVDRNQAEHEARAKISWGDSNNSVIQYLMMQGFNAQEAAELVNKLYKERLAATRANGVRKIFIGSGLVCVPIAAFIFFLSIGYMPLKLMGIAVAIGLWGAWMVLSGILLIVAPRMESGDVAEQ